MNCLCFFVEIDVVKINYLLLKFTIMKTLKILFVLILVAGLYVVTNAQPNPATQGSASFFWSGTLPCIEDEYLYGNVTVTWVVRWVEGKYTGHGKYDCDFTGYPSEKKYDVVQLNNDFDNWNSSLVGTHTMKLMISLEGKKIGMITFVYHHNIDYTQDPWEWLNDVVLDEVKCF